MLKNYDLWHKEKAIINNVSKPPYFHEREIWFCHLGLNIGFEQDGRGEAFLRPVLILRKFNQEIFWAIPLTKNKKKPSKYYYPFSFIPGIISSAILSQIRLIDSRRLARKIGTINGDEFAELIKRLKALLP